MTQALDARGIDSDRIDGGGRGVWRLVVIALVLGVIVGGLAGFAYGAVQPKTYTASTALSVLPDSTVNGQQDANEPSQDSTSYIQSQLVVLNGDQLASTVQQQLSLPASPDVSSTQVGQTYVVQVTATATDRARASAIVTATGQAYAKLRTDQLGATIDSQAATVNAQLAAVQASLAAEQKASPLTVTSSESALQTQYQQLLQTQSNLAVAKSQVARVVTVLSPASIAAVGSLSATSRSVLLGALLGAVVALALALVIRRVRPRVRSVGDLSSLGVPVLLPVLPTRSRRAARGTSPWRSNAGRLLAARLSSRGAARNVPIIVVSPTPGVGTSHVAATLAAGISERGPVLLVLASELVHGSDTRTLRALSATDVSADIVADSPAGSIDAIKQAVQCEIPGVWVLPCGGQVARSAGPLPSSRLTLLTEILRKATSAGWQVIVDAPALSESDLAVDCAAGAGVAVLVVGRGVSRPADVVSASELFDAQNSRFLGAILNGTPSGFARRGTRRNSDGSEGLQVSFDPPELPASDAHDRPRRRRPVPVTATRSVDRTPAATAPGRGSSPRP